MLEVDFNKNNFELISVRKDSNIFTSNCLHTCNNRENNSLIDLTDK